MLEDCKTMLHALKTALRNTLRTGRTGWVYILTDLLWYVLLMLAPAAAQGILGTPDGVGTIVFLSLSFAAALAQSLFEFFHDGRQKRLWCYIRKDWSRYALLLFISAASLYIYRHTISGM